MKKNISKSLLILILLQCFIGFAQEQVVTGKVTTEDNMPLPGASILEKGTSNGVVSDIDGNYTIQLKNANAILVFSYVNYKAVEKTTTGKNRINVQLQVDTESLEEVVITTGIRSSQLRSVKLKREATTVIEAITPEDIGSFQDINVADALERVPSVQIERNVDGVSGDRVSIRGIGPQFVRVTLNGRSPISAGSEGRSDMRKFNLNVIPTEIISGARIHKTTEAKEVSTAIGGTVDFQTLRPLDKKYKKGENYFASFNTRASSNTESDDLDFGPRISGVVGGKINDKLGIVASVLYSDETFAREESALRGYRVLDFREDTNNDGTFNTDDGDQLFEDILIPATINNGYIKDSREHIALSAALQYKPTDRLEFLIDYSRTQLKNDSERQFFQMTMAPGGNNGLLGQSDNNFFSPGSIGFNGNNLQFIDAAGANRSRVNIQNRITFYDNYTTNNIMGLNTRYKASDKLSINFDLSYSNLDFFQNLINAGTIRLR
jgi:TonB-dependent receptor